MSDTPRTDALIEHMPLMWPAGVVDSVDILFDSHRTLERENAALREHIEKMQRLATPREATEEMNKMLREQLATERRRVVEECAKVCDDWRRTETLESCCDGAQHNALKSCAGLIRVLAEPQSTAKEQK